MDKLIAVLEGDGIGPEITTEGLKVLKAIEIKYSHSFKLSPAPFGAQAYFSHGSPFPDETKAVCDTADAIIKGPVGLSVKEMDSIPQESRPEIGAILPLRKRYNTYLNFRPVYLPKELAHFSPLRPEIIGDGIDILMIRELVGGIYFGEKKEGLSTGMEYASDDCTYTRAQVTDIAKAAFSEAVKKNSPLFNVHKANVLATSRFWNRIVEEVSDGFPEVPLHSILVDNAAFQLVKNPAQFNGVMLLDNMQGDILTDQAGGILGSLGLMPSACIGPEKGYVEPAHGSAPDIAGRNIANPYSMIGSVAFMLDKCFGLEDESAEIWRALFRLFADGYTTPELAGREPDGKTVLTTREFGDRIVKYIED